MTGFAKRVLWASMAASLVWSGCADVEPPAALEGAPSIQRVSRDKIMIGEVFAVEGVNFLDVSEGQNYLRFEGQFSGRGGFSERVEIEAPAFVVEDQEGRQTLQWVRFGPFHNPFSDKGEAGRFEGKLVPVTETLEGLRVFGAPVSAGFDVLPSIEFLEFQPEGADCGIPALSGVSGIPYRLKVRAAGFVPSEFEFQITSLQGAADLRTPEVFSVAATGPEAALGEELDLVFQDVPADVKFYTAGVLVRARDAASGRFVESVLPFEIHRPIEIEYTGNLQVAERYASEPATACIPGSIGNSATYSETQTEMRQRTISVRIGQSFVEEQGVSNAQSWSEGYQTGELVSSSSSRSETDVRTEGSALSRDQGYNESDANNFSHGTTDAETWNSSHTAGAELSVSVGAEGGASIPLVAEGKVSSSVTGTGRYSHQWGRGGVATASNQWGSTTSRGSSRSMGESYTLTNSTSDTRSFTDSVSRSSSRTYNFGGSAVASERISRGTSEDEALTWSESSSSTTLTSYSGFIPVGRFGVFYRQTIRMVRVAQIVSYNACGERELMGEMLLNEWKWAPDLAIGDSCDAALPPSNHPPAECLIPPCD